MFRNGEINNIGDEYFADVIYHDGEEDDIITVLLNAKKKPEFKCYMQMSGAAMVNKTQEAIKIILGNRKCKNNIAIKFYSLKIGNIHFKKL